MKTNERLRETYGYFEDFSLSGFLGAPAHIVSREADGIRLSWPAERHLRRRYRRLGRVLVVAVEEVRRQEDGHDEGEEQGGGDDSLTHVVAYHF